MALQTNADKPAAPGRVRTYEVQRHEKGRWIVDTLADDKEVAIESAKMLMTGRRPPSGVRVMAVELKDSGKFSEISVYRSTIADGGRDEAPAPRPKIEVKAKPTAEMRDFTHAERSAPAQEVKGSGFKNAVRALVLAFGVGAALAAFQALRVLMR